LQKVMKKRREKQMIETPTGLKDFSPKNKVSVEVGQLALINNNFINIDSIRIIFISFESPR